jgi:uncharacterized protein YndB with AHSA1/START domain
MRLTFDTWQLGADSLAHVLGAVRGTVLVPVIAPLLVAASTVMPATFASDASAAEPVAATSGATSTGTERGWPAHVEDRSYSVGGERVLQLVATIPAPPRDVWRLLTTSEGFVKWGAPKARVDLRVGGAIESSYDPAAEFGAPTNIRNEIVAIVPERVFVIRNVQAPPGAPFDVPTFQETQTAMLLEPVDGGTRFTLLNAGYREGERYDRTYRHFRLGNAMVLEALRSAAIGEGAAAHK